MIPSCPQAAQLRGPAAPIHPAHSGGFPPVETKQQGIAQKKECCPHLICTFQPGLLSGCCEDIHPGRADWATFTQAEQTRRWEVISGWTVLNAKLVSSMLRSLMVCTESNKYWNTEFVTAVYQRIGGGKEWGNDSEGEENGWKFFSSIVMTKGIRWRRFRTRGAKTLQLRGLGQYLEDRRLPLSSTVAGSQEQLLLMWTRAQHSKIWEILASLT